MKIYIVQGGHPTIQGNPMKPFATKEAANSYAAELVNMILSDYTDDEDDKPIIAPDATAETWESKCLEYRQSIADDMEVDLDDLEDDDAGDVWIVTEDLIGGDEIYAKIEEIKTSPREWIVWDGSVEPPLPAGQHVDVLLRCGVWRSGKVGEDGYAKRWQHMNYPDDIVGYIPMLTVETVPEEDMKPIKGVKLERKSISMEKINNMKPGDVIDLGSFSIICIADLPSAIRSSKTKEELAEMLNRGTTLRMTKTDAVGIQDGGIGKTEEER